MQQLTFAPDQQTTAQGGAFADAWRCDYYRAPHHHTMETNMDRCGILVSRITWFMFVLTAVWAGGAFAAEELTVEQQVAMARSLNEAQRQATIAANVSLTEAESAKFWPLYREYRNDVEKVNDETIALMKEFATNYETLSDSRATSIANRWFAMQKQRLALKKKYTQRYGKVLGGAKMVRVLQIENKLDALTEVNLARSLPLVPAGS
jgi:hypothetical protein